MTSYQFLISSLFVVGSYRVSQKNVVMFQTAITPSILALSIKVGWVLKSSGSPFAEGHWNFLISTFGGWENGV